MENDYCRLCMGDDALKIMDIPTLDIIRNEFSIVVHLDDELSREICSPCDDFLSKYVSFKTKVNKTQGLLRKILGRKRKDVNNDSAPAKEPFIIDEASQSKNKSSEPSQTKNKSSEPSQSKNKSSEPSERNSLNDQGPSKINNKISKPVSERRSLVGSEAAVICLIDDSINTSLGISNQTPGRRSLNDKEPIISLIDDFSKMSKKSSESTSEKKGVSNVGPDSSKITSNNSKDDTTKDLTAVTASEDLIKKIIKSINLNDVQKNTEELKNFNPANPNCDICNAKVSDFDEFRKHVNSKNHLFKSLVVKKLGDPTIFNHHRVGYTCPICKEIFSSKVVMCTHSKDVHKQPINRNLITPDTIIPKRKCDETSGKIAVEELTSIVKEEPGISAQKNFICRFCNRAFGFIESLHMHHKKHHKDIFLCFHCNHASKSRRAFVVHLREHYGLKYSQKMCSQCFKICQTHLELTTHRKEAHEDVVFVCAVCHKKFPNSTALKKHKRDVHRAHNEEIEKNNEYMCRRCNKSFLTALVLEKHACAALKYPCLKKCHKRFDTYSEMHRHSIKCTLGTTIYQCQFCKKSLKSLKTLQRHLLTCPKMLASTSAGTSKDTRNANTTHRPETSSSQTQSPMVVTKQDTSSPVNKKLKTSSEQLAEKNTFNCKRCLKKISSIKEFDEHVKNCLKRKRPPTRTKILKSKPRVVKKPTKKTSRVRKVVKKTIITKIDPKAEEQSKILEDLSCKICGIVLKNKLFLSVHRFTVHGPTTPLPAESPSKDPICLKTPPNDRNNTLDLSQVRKPTTPLNLNSRMVSSSTATSSTKNEMRQNHHPDDRSLPRIEPESSKINKPTTPIDLRMSSTPQVATSVEIEKTRQNYHLNNRPSPRREHEFSQFSRPTYSPDSSRNYYYDGRPLPRTDQRHYRPNTNRFSSGYNRSSPVSPVTNVNQKTNPNSTKLLQPDYLVQERRSTPQLTIIPNNNDICYICRNPQPHLFCSGCARCFRQNQVQYLNHMKMKHSSK